MHTRNYSSASPSQVDEIGRTLVNFVAVVPAGVVVFFPSYSFKDKVLRALAESGSLHRIERFKKAETCASHRPLSDFDDRPAINACRSPHPRATPGLELNSPISSQRQ